MNTIICLPSLFLVCARANGIFYGFPSATFPLGWKNGRKNKIIKNHLEKQKHKKEAPISTLNQSKLCDLQTTQKDYHRCHRSPSHCTGTATAAANIGRRRPTVIYEEPTLSLPWWASGFHGAPNIIRTTGTNFIAAVVIYAERRRAINVILCNSGGEKRIRCRHGLANRRPPPPLRPLFLINFLPTAEITPIPAPGKLQFNVERPIASRGIPLGLGC